MGKQVAAKVQQLITASKFLITLLIIRFNPLVQLIRAEIKILLKLPQ